MMRPRTVNWTHFQVSDTQDKTYCGVPIWEGVRVTQNPAQVTCPDCTKEDSGQSILSDPRVPVALMAA